MALHDCFHDYVSRGVLTVTGPDTLAVWPVDEAGTDYARPSNVDTVCDLGSSKGVAGAALIGYDEHRL